MHPTLVAEKTPDKPAIVMAATGESLTYRQLEDRSNQGAHLFRSLGLKVGDGVAIFMENNIRFLEICWAAQRAGLYYTCVSSRLTAGEVEYIVKDCRRQGARHLARPFEGGGRAGAAHSRREPADGRRHAARLRVV